MSGLRPPNRPAPPQGPFVAGLREAAERQSQADADAPRRSLGMPISQLITTDRQLAVGDLAYCDPTLATGSVLHLYLPKADAKWIGDKISVKNYSASTNTIRVHAAGNDTIDKEPTKDMAIAWELATFLLISGTEWICFKGDGCL